ncbi:hypothetical protein PHET_04067 [Paragonimus heterotremus]|uniref:Uncharacterized protein n=1 Tax=Paragonimus heterotremus TaxID=100268 RepID=A0A8J4TGY5_9TREM|nr:hypothetical protein PHET_04067 [Paragonimus heterotremus]
MLRPNLPATNSWMSTLNKLTDMQRRAASNFYQTSLKQIEEHSRTLGAIMHLLDILTNQKKEDSTVCVKADSLVQFAKHLENDCHLQWLRLLELTLCIDQKNLQIFSVTTHLSSQRKRQKTLCPINPPSNHSAFNFGMSKDRNGRFSCNVIFNPLDSRERFHGLKMQPEQTMSTSGPKSTRRHRTTFLSQPTIYKGGPESGFESELSPQMNCFSKAIIKPGTSCPHPMRRSTDSLIFPVDSLHLKTGKWSYFLINLQCDNAKTVCDVQREDSLNRIMTFRNNLTEQYRSRKSQFERNIDAASSDGYIPNSSWKKSQNPTDPKQRKRSYVQTNMSNSVCEETGTLEMNCVANCNESPKSNGACASQRRQKPKRRPQRPRITLTAGVQSPNPILAHLAHSSELDYDSLNSSSHSSLPLDTLSEDQRSISSSTEANSYATSTHCKTHNEDLIQDVRTANFEPDHPILMSEGLSNCTEEQLWIADANRRSSLPTMYCDTAPMEVNRSHELFIPETLPMSGVFPSRMTDQIGGQFCCRHSHSILLLRKEHRENSQLNLSATNVQKNHSEETVTKFGRSSLQAFGWGPYQSQHNRCLRDSSSCSSINGDACDLEQKQWASRLKSYLDAAAQAEALVREQQVVVSMNPEASNWKTDSARQPVFEESPCRARSVETHKAESQEPLLNCWDDYQVPLYSSSGETDPPEPASTYAEEFPWDDVGEACLSDASHEGQRGLGGNLRGESPTDYNPFRSSMTSVAQADHNVEPAIEGSTVGRQDTMDLSTTTSILFNQKSSSMEVSFEVCSPSVVTTESQTGEFLFSNLSHHSVSSQLLYGVRTHPDGGSQHRIDREQQNQQLVMSESNNEQVLTLDEDNVPMGADFLTVGRNSPPVLVEKRCQTLPRVLQKKHFYKEEPIDKKPFTCPSSLTYLDRLCNPSVSWMQSDFLHWSKQRLLETQSALYALFAKPFKTDAAWDECTLSQLQFVDAADTQGEMHDPALASWQQELTQIIRQAESHLHMFVDRTETKRTTEDQSMGINTPVLCSLIRWSADPEIITHQLQWIRLIDEARHWLRQSYADEKIRQNLRYLRARVLQLVNTLHNLLSPFSTGEHYDENFVQNDLDACEKDRIENRISLYITELNSINSQVQRLQQDLDVCLSNTSRKASTLYGGYETAVRMFTMDNAELREQLDRLQEQVKRMQKRLSGLNMLEPNTKSTTPMDTGPLGAEGSWTQRSFSISHVKTVDQTNLSDSDVENLSRIPTKNKSISAITYRQQQKRNYYYILVAGSLLAFACFCYYVLTRLFPCTGRSFGWRTPWFALERAFGFDFRIATGNACPLKRERMSVFADYTQSGSVPF